MNRRRTYQFIRALTRSSRRSRCVSGARDRRQEGLAVFVTVISRNKRSRSNIAAELECRPKFDDMLETGHQAGGIRCDPRTQFSPYVNVVCITTALLWDTYAIEFSPTDRTTSDRSKWAKSSEVPSSSSQLQHRECRPYRLGRGSWVSNGPQEARGLALVPLARTKVVRLVSNSSAN